MSTQNTERLRDGEQKGADFDHAPFKMGVFLGVALSIKPQLL